jgi:subtilase family serine protease
LKSLSSTLAAAVAGTAIAAVAVPAHAAQLTPSARVIQPALVRRDVRDLGLAAASTKVDIAVTLNYRNAAELRHLVDLQSTPGSPLFRHYLTPAQFAAEFAPTPASYMRIARTLQAAGFRVTRTYGNRTMIDASGTAAAATGLFKTQIHRVVQSRHGIRYGNATAATIPASLSSDVLTVAGLDNFVKMRTNSLVTHQHPTGSPGAGDSGAPIERIVGGTFEGYYPTAYAKAYKFPNQLGFNGQGQSIGIVMDSDIPNSDLQSFWTAARINRTGKFHRITVDTYPGVNVDESESALDIEESSSLAPAADVDLYMIADLGDPSVEDGYNLVLEQHAVDVVSSSFGTGELDDIPFAVATENLAIQGAAEGITFLAGAGDWGAYAPGVAEDGSLYYEPDGVILPAADPHFLAVGGTQLTIDPKTGARVSETAWNFDPTYMMGGGGGVSSYFPRPAYQNRVKGMAVVPAIAVAAPSPQVNSGFAGRNLPDISFNGAFVASSMTAVYETYDYGPSEPWVEIGGTSVSSPVAAAMVAEWNQQLRYDVGFVNPALYGAFSARGLAPQGVYGELFNDITSGTIGLGWTAARGYDQTTGIGSIFNGSL